MRMIDVDTIGRTNAGIIVAHLRALRTFTAVRPVMLEILPPNAKFGDLPFRFYGAYSMQEVGIENPNSKAGRQSEKDFRSRFDLAGDLVQLFAKGKIDSNSDSKIVYRDADVGDDASDWFRACYYTGEVKPCCPVGPWFCLMRWPHERHGRIGGERKTVTYHATNITLEH